MASRPVYLLLASLLVGFAFRVSTPPSVAQTASSPEPSPTIDCNKANSTVEINYCAGLNYQEADRALNQTYQRLKSTLNSAQQTKLIAAQQAWIEYRDKNCDFASRNWIGGTGYSAVLTGCLEQVTRKRTQELQNLPR